MRERNVPKRENTETDQTFSYDVYVYITKCSAGQKHGHELFVRCERCAKRGVAGMEAICNGKNLLAAIAASVHATV